MKFRTFYRSVIASAAAIAFVFSYSYYEPTINADAIKQSAPIEKINVDELALSLSELDNSIKDLKSTLENSEVDSELLDEKKLSILTEIEDDQDFRNAKNAHFANENINSGIINLVSNDEEVELTNSLISKVDNFKTEWVELETLEAERIEAERIEAERLEAERIAAEKLEAERQAAAALESESWSGAQSVESTYSGSSSHSDHVQPVYAFDLRVGGYGGQAQIDACIGAIWWEGYPNYLAEHWHCGGASFPQYAGAIVNVPGTGQYEVIGIVNIVPAGSDTTSIPGGYDLIYQTCLNNDTSTMAMIALKRIG